MKARRILIVLLALVLTFSTAVFAAEPFTDVAEDAYYAAAVDWAVEKEITFGKGNGIFAPDATVTRAEAVTFLWRMAGSPEPTGTETFTDVEADANNWWYKTAVQWAVEKGITVGTGKGNFSPTVTCSRGMILTMLYRLEDKPFDAAMEAAVPEDSEDWTLEDLSNSLVQFLVESYRSESGFTDVNEGDYYELPVYWAATLGVLDENQLDTDAMAVLPNAPCPRGEMVYFLYHASGDAPAPAAEPSVETGTLPETAVLDADGVKVTLNGIECDEYGSPRLNLTVVNGSEKALRMDVSDFSVNTYAFSPQAYIPQKNEDNWVFYADAVAEPGETKDYYISLSSLKDMGITAVYELEMKAVCIEVEKDEEGYYSYVDEYSEGELVSLRTDLDAEGVSYDMEGQTVCEKDGLVVRVTEAENNEFTGPELTLYAYNGGSEEQFLELAALKLDGVDYDAFFSMTVPAGKRVVSELNIYIDYDNVPVISEAELALQLVDPDTWEPTVVFDSVKVPFEK